MNLTTKNLTNINKVATEVHRKYVAGTHTGEVFSKEKCGKKYSVKRNVVRSILKMMLRT